VRFAPIAFSTPVEDEDTIAVTLQPAVWPADYDPDTRAPPIEHYRVTFRLGHLTDYRRRRLVHGVKQAVADQRKDHKAHSKTWKTYLFFLGEQESDDRAVFTVHDHRLASFRRLHADVFSHLQRAHAPILSVVPPASSSSASPRFRTPPIRIPDPRRGPSHASPHTLEPRPATTETDIS